MLKFAANLSMLFTEFEFLDRFAAAARAGFKAVEFTSPYEYEPAQIADILRRNNLALVQFNLPLGDFAAGERGIACMPDRAGEFQDGVARTIEYARTLGNSQVNCLAGKPPEGLPRDQAQAALVSNIGFAAKALKEAGILLIMEPVCQQEMPGFFLSGSAAAMALFDQVGSENLKLQYDIYHMQRTEGELAATIERLMPRIAHFQIAGNPNRTEPDRGEINYPYLFTLIDALGYQGWISAEYRPVKTTIEGLGWLVKWSR